MGRNWDHLRRPQYFFPGKELARGPGGPLHEYQSSVPSAVEVDAVLTSDALRILPLIRHQYGELNNGVRGTLVDVDKWELVQSLNWEAVGNL